MLKPQKGWITLCAYCGEQVGNKTKHCPDCRTRKGREAILEANQKILKQLRAKGFCLGEISFIAP